MSTPVRDLNEIAGKSPRRSPRKRRATEPFEDEPALKRPSPDTIEVAGNETRASLVLKKTPKSLKRRSGVRFAPEPRTGKDGFEVPAESGTKKSQTESAAPEETTSAKKAETQPKKKKRLLKYLKDRPPNPSPFKGVPHGTLNPEAVVGATLTSTDSPAKNTRNKAVNPLIALSNDAPGENPELVIRFPPRKSRRESSLREATRAEDIEPEDGAGEEVDHVFRYKKADRDELARQSGGQMEDADVHIERQQTDLNKPMATSTAGKRQTPTKKLRTKDKSPGTRSVKSPKKLNSVQERKKEEKEAQRQIQREKERKQRAANAAESAEDEQQEMEARRIKFMKGIEDAATSLTLYEAFADLGAGAMYVRSKFPAQERLATRADAVARSISSLRLAYNGFEGQGDNVLQNEKEVSKTLSILRQRSSVGNEEEPPFLHEQPGNKQKHGDNTVLDLYGHVIPQCAMLLKKVLQVRWKKGLSLQGKKEVRKVAKILLDLCTLAMEWDPRPSTLESGIMSKVKQKIKPNAEMIRERLGRFIEYDERRSYERRIETERLERIRKIHELRPTAKQSREEQDQVAQLATRQTREDYQYSDSEKEQPEIAATPSPRLQRRMTEEIPAPDPNTSWTRREDIALLNSLQEYTQDDRFERILSNCPQLRHKDVDELISRAKFHRRSCDKAAEDKGYWWLLNIAL